MKNYNTIKHRLIGKRLQYLILLELAMLIGAGTATRADEAPTDDKPGWTLSLSGAFDHTGRPNTPAPANNAYNVYGDIGVGYFLTEHIQAEVSLGASTFGDNDGFNSGQMNYLAAAKYHFWPRKDFVPYLGVQGGGVTRFYPGQTTFNPAGGGMAGFNYFLTEKHRTSVFMEYNFLYSRDTLAQQDVYDNKVKIGFQFWFGN
jgi:hypothetical protein